MGPRQFAADNEEKDAHLYAELGLQWGRGNLPRITMILSTGEGTHARRFNGAAAICRG